MSLQTVRRAKIVSQGNRQPRVRKQLSNAKQVRFLTLGDDFYSYRQT